MNLLKKLTVIMVLIIGISVAFAPVATVNAQLFSGSKNEACKGATLSDKCDKKELSDSSTKVSDTLGKIVNIITVIIGIAAVIVIIVNGLRFITSGGDSNAISSARNGIIYAIVGLIIVALAQVIVRFIIKRIYD